MNEIEKAINQLESDCKVIDLPDSLVSNEYALVLVKSNSSSTLAIVPEPYRSQVIELGLSVTDTWISISSSGSTDHSKDAEKLNRLVNEYVSKNSKIT